VIAAVPQHHRDVVERDGRRALRAHALEKDRPVLLETGAVAEFLQVGDLDVDESFLERVEALLD